MKIRVSEEYNEAINAINNLLEDRTLHEQETTISSRLDLGNYRLLKGYLVIGVTSNERIENVTKWKITLNEVTLTREFKPHVEARINERIHQSLFVYDVTKILSSMQQEAILKIKYEGKRPITVNSATLISFHHYLEASSKSDCIFEIASLNSYMINLTSCNNHAERFNERVLYLGIVTDQKDDIQIMNEQNETLYTQRLVNGFNLIELNLQDINANELIIKSVAATTRLIFHCITCTSINYPRIEVKDLSILKDVNAIELKLLNGGADADNCEVILLKAGNLVQRFDIGVFKSGEEKFIRIPLTQGIGKTSGKLILRIIWQKALRLFSREYVIDI
jgi:hypothetical protein